MSNQESQDIHENVEPTTEENTTETTENSEEQANAEPSEVEQLQAKIAELETAVEQAKLGQARATADSYNAQKRMEQETAKAKKFALQKFAKELLEVVDNFERAIDSAEQSGAEGAVVEGLHLTHKSLLTVLTKNGVEVVNPLGEKFNPDYHEAVGISPDAEKDMVGVVLQKGYILHDRSIRPAMVQVGA
ncbi:MAG: nucleotide exchange factor GrpE [Moraxellaceae bacterium]|nr:nucleotide exchange factor GrpE [Moraxellaceae bacterium]